MKVFALIFRNLLRHKLRTTLTITGIGIAVMAFALLRTVISSWYAGIDATAPDRIIVRHSVSFIFPLPYYYGQRIASVDGVTDVTYQNWFQGKYIDNRNFFPRIAVDAASTLRLYPEFLLPDDQKADFMRERKACIVGVKTAQKYGFKPGDIITIEGDIYPGSYDFIVRGIYHGRDKSTDETQMFFHWAYLDECLRRDMPARAGNVGWFVVRIANPSDAPRISADIDDLFRNSPAETKTETEKAFAQGFISMSSAIISAMQFVSYIVIGIILLVLANTMVMTARERITEYAVLKTLGFRTVHLLGLIAGEAILISVLGGSLGIALTYPVCAGVALAMSSFFPVFEVTQQTLAATMGFALLVGVLSSIVPVYRAMNTSIVEGLRHIG